MEDHSTINRTADTNRGSLYSKKRRCEVRGQQYIKYVGLKLLGAKFPHMSHGFF